MISDDIHILTNDDLEAREQDAYRRGWRAGRDFHDGCVLRLQRLEQENARSTTVADPADVSVWLAHLHG